MNIQILNVHDHFLEIQLKKTLSIISACLLLCIDRIYAVWKKWVYSWKWGNSESKGKISSLLYLECTVSTSLNMLSFLVRGNGGIALVIFTRSGLILSEVLIMEAIVWVITLTLFQMKDTVYFVCCLMESG